MPGWAKARKQEADSRRQDTTNRRAILAFLLPTDCILSPGSCLLLSAVCRLASYRQSLLQDIFLRLLDRHSVSLTILIDWTMLEYVVPLLVQSPDFPKRIFRLSTSGCSRRFRFLRFRQRRALFQCLAK